MPCSLLQVGGWEGILANGNGNQTDDLTPFSPRGGALPVDPATASGSDIFAVGETCKFPS